MPKVGKYELGKTVGRGAFSKVKVAIHLETGEEYVIKIIDKRGGGDKSESQVEKDVKHEISIMKVLHHENIVRMYEVMESSKHFYIVLESVRGGDLCDHVMDAGKLEEKVAAKFLHHLVEGLIACHAAGVAHRDIKPENCLISSEGVLKVADFGLSRLHRGRGDIADSSEMSTDSVGTLSYAAPEVLSGKYNAFKADLWSIGVVIFVMLTGKFPFGSKGYTEAQIQADIRRAKINKFPAHVSSEARALVMSLIVLDPEKRLPLQGILEQDWLRAQVPSAGTLPSIAGSPGARRTRPQGIDVDQVVAEARAMQQRGGVIEDTMSPTWQDSPAGGERRHRFQPALMTPHSQSPRGSSSPRASTSSPRGSPDALAELQALREKMQHEHDA
eukprot:TRINITY_DN16108_c0_g1_i1.p1 TRINITY_DN16108_c0_g1~~TRINITY_DN16108_c0_g1_i1.p1  ORF type:complete len:387 (+),score=56.42 TRINITY_DN16108_c0_g1_i1:222-1382(+)